MAPASLLFRKYWLVILTTRLRGAQVQTAAECAVLQYLVLFDKAVPSTFLGAAMYKGQNLLELEPEERARSGLFMSFQSPVEVPGVSNAEFLRISANARRMAQGMPELDPLEFYGFITPKVYNGP